MRTTQTAFLPVILVAAMLFVSACDESIEEAQILYPPYPYWENEAIRIDADRIQELATAYCLAAPSKASSEDFFLADLPLFDFDQIFEGPISGIGDEVMGGDIYLSGYFGGLWLRDALHPPEAGPSAMNDTFESLHGLFDVIASNARRDIDLVEKGSDPSVIRKAGDMIRLHMFIYAYDRGYLEQIIAHPPAGLTPPAGLLVCSNDLVLDCRSPDLNLPFLNRYEEALANLRNPPTKEWEKLRKEDDHAWVWVEQGRQVWNVIDISSLGERNYLLLLDLSLNFLLTSQAAVLGSMTGRADREPDEARRSLMAGSAMITWSTSYVMGLMLSPAPYGTFPTLECPRK